MLNPELKKGDRVVLGMMKGETEVLPGDKGTCTGVGRDYNEIRYEMIWDNGCKYPLYPSEDVWFDEEYYEKKQEEKLKQIEKRKKINENNENERLLANIDVFKFFKMKFLKAYLKMVRDSGITNMFGASPYLYIGSEKIRQEMLYKDLEGEEFEPMLEHADEARDLMIQGTVNWLESENKEISIDNVRRFLPRFAVKVLENYMILY